MASALIGTGKTLAVMPLGVVISPAKDPSLPLDMASWITALGSMGKRRIDVGDLDGRIFLHMVVIGLSPSPADDAGQVCCAVIIEFLEERKSDARQDGLSMALRS